MVGVTLSKGSLRAMARNTLFLSYRYLNVMVFNDSKTAMTWVNGPGVPHVPRVLPQDHESFASVSVALPGSRVARNRGRRFFPVWAISGGLRRRFSSTTMLS